MELQTAGFVAGTKLPGFDCSVWEDKYKKSGEVNDAFTTPDAKTMSLWSLESIYRQ